MKRSILLAIPVLVTMVFALNASAQQPVISSFAPLSGAAGSSVTITGSGFNTTAANNIVYFGAVRAVVTAATATSLTVTVPVGASYQPIFVLNTASTLRAYSRLPFTTTFNGCAPFNAGSLAARVSFAAGSATRSVIFGDFDRDGKADMVATNTGTADMSVFRNNSSGGTVSFQPKVDIVTGVPGSGASGLMTGDIDGDGKLDVITSNYNTTNMSVFLNTSSGSTISFAAKVDFTTAINPLGIVIGDLDRDGKPDLAVANFLSGSVSIFRNTSTPGSVSFVSQTLTGFTSPRELGFGDMDNDGKVDLLVADEGSSAVWVCRNTSPSSGTISFATAVSYSTATNPRGLSLGDIDGDGKLDVAIVNTGAASVSVLRNTTLVPGTITFAAKQDFACGSSPREVALGDIDGDGKPEMAASSNGSASLCVFRNTSTSGSISFAGKIDFAAGNNTLGVWIGDVNNDGKMDIAATSNSTGTVGVFENLSPVSTLSGISPAVTTTSVCDNSTWKTLYDPVTNGVIASIKDNGNNLGSISATAYVESGPGMVSNGQRYLQRHYVITPATQPVTPVQVRLYFTDAELLALQGVDPSIITVNNISVTKYSGLLEDGVYNPTLGVASLIPSTVITPGTAYGGRYIEFTVSSFSEFWLHGGFMILPVTQGNFSADKKTGGILLKWSTNSQNATGFVVERSNNGVSYTKIVDIAAAADAPANRSYSYIDQNPLNGTNYYRIQTLDADGHRTSSKVLPVSWSKTDGVSVAIAGQSGRQVHATISGKVNGELIVYDAKGSRLKTVRINTGTSATVVDIDLSAYSSGIYLYQLVTGSGIASKGKLFLK
jgi:hypothetical protein